MKKFVLIAVCYHLLFVPMCLSQVEDGDSVTTDPCVAVCASEEALTGLIVGESSAYCSCLPASNMEAVSTGERDSTVYEAVSNSDPDAPYPEYVPLGEGVGSEEEVVMVAEEG